MPMMANPDLAGQISADIRRVLEISAANVCPSQTQGW
jgi:hypothetical protein